MSNFNFNKALLNLAGKPFLSPEEKEITIGSVLAPSLSDHNQGDPLKFFSWAVTIFNGGDLSLDKSDVITLKEFITTTLSLNNLAKAQILDIINE
jgi:hypothetical protein